MSDPHMIGPTAPPGDPKTIEAPLIVTEVLPLNATTFAVIAMTVPAVAVTAPAGARNFVPVGSVI